MANDDDITPTIMNNKCKLIETFMIGDQAVRAVERIVMGVAVHLQRSLHGLATQQ